MKKAIFIFVITLGIVTTSGLLQAQSTGDYRSAVNGLWESAATWETYNGTAWVPAVNPPTGAENITIKDTVSAGTLSITITGYVKVTDIGVLTVGVGELASVTFANGSTYEHARNAGTIPMSTWNVGSLAKFTGITTTAPGNRIQSFSKIIWDNPLQTANLNMGWNNVTITGDITINSTGTGRWYFAGPTTGSSAIFTINGNIIHNGGNFATHGTGNGNTTIVVNHFGNITATGGNFSICRGSQSGTGTTDWYLHGNLSLTNTETQNSNPTGARFVFAGTDVRSLLLNTVTFSGGGLPLKVDSLATLSLGGNVIAGNGAFTVNNYGGVITSHPDGLNGNITTTGTISLSNLGNYGFNGTAAQVTGALLPASVNNFSVANPSGVTLSGNLLVNGTMELVSGSLIPGGNALTYGSSVTLAYRGTSQQTTGDIEFPATGGPLNLIVQNSANVLLHADRTINGDVSILQGDLNLNGHTLILGPTAMLNENPGATVGGLSGKITTTRTLNAPGGVNPGNLGAVITSASNLGATLVERYHGVRTGNSNQSIYRSYNIVPTNNTALNATLRFHYDESELNGIAENNLRLFRSATGNNNTWNYAGGTANASENYVELTGISNFSYWTLADVNAPVPVELLSFTASVTSGKVNLSWSTATENQNRGWEVERKTNDNWIVIGFVEGMGTSTTTKVYGFVDSGTPGGLVSYRLKQIDFDGSTSYSKTVEVNSDYLPEEFRLSQNYPNPFNPVTTIKFEVPVASFTELSVYNLLGEKVAGLVNEMLEPGIYERHFDGSNLSSGLYIYRLEAEGTALTKSMMLLK